MNIEQLVSAHLELIVADQERWLALLSDDAVVEFPYAISLGTPTRLQGRAAIREHFARAVENFTDFSTAPPRCYKTTDPEIAIVEVHGSATIKSTGKRYEQDYVMLIQAKHGRIVLYREYWNPLAVVDTGMQVK